MSWDFYLITFIWLLSPLNFQRNTTCHQVSGPAAVRSPMQRMASSQVAWLHKKSKYSRTEVLYEVLTAQTDPSYWKLPFFFICSSVIYSSQHFGTKLSPLSSDELLAFSAHCVSPRHCLFRVVLAEKVLLLMCCRHMEMGVAPLTGSPSGITGSLVSLVSRHHVQPLLSATQPSIGFEVDWRVL